ncbi:MAG: hypothetical protein JOZ24_11455, partial [Candidatus Eremiobacteraeota bacterium]|nr:hypothetical protein [Candidatus Eremiobacteraeota bacterium]
MENAHVRPVSGRSVTARRLRLSAAVAAAIVPGAILVHLGAEALSLGRSGLGIEFLVRHLYLGGL